MFSFFFFSSVLSFVLVLRRWIQKWRGTARVAYSPLSERRQQQSPPETDVYTLVTSLASMGIIMAYFFLCDR
jgi:hypothetical protein